MPPRPQLDLDVDLLIERGGHELKLSGSGIRFVARFPTLRSLFHHLRFFWPARNLIPGSVQILVEWRKLRVNVRSPRE
jgi:hypothetical protein